MAHTARAKNALYSLPRDHVVWRVTEYLQLHRGEALNRQDIATKFDIAATTVDDVLAPAVAAGHLKKARDSENVVVWRGPRGQGVNFPAPFTGSLTAAAARNAKAAQRALKVIDFDKIVIDQGVPLQERAKTDSRWKMLFDRMAAGDSFSLAAEHRMALDHAKQKYTRDHTDARFATRKTPDGSVRIWRLA